MNLLRKLVPYVDKQMICQQCNRWGFVYTDVTVHTSKARSAEGPVVSLYMFKNDETDVSRMRIHVCQTGNPQPTRLVLD